MNKEVIATEQAPKAVGPYSQAIRVGDLVYTSGQIGLDPATNKLVMGADAAETIQLQTTQVLRNLTAVLEAADSSLHHVVKTTVFLESMSDYGVVNTIYAQFFGETPPARSAVAVAGLPLGAKVEIEAVAVRKITSNE
jgi:2-iminobutanoate/2-iminopropanoate deaminase